jgi:thioredoxin-related protein
MKPPALSQRIYDYAISVFGHCLSFSTLLALMAAPNLSWADAPDGYPFLPFDQAMAQSKRESKPLFVYFGRYGCGYCEKTNREAFADPLVRERYIRHYVLAYVDAESGNRIRLHSGERITERELGTRYDALVTPVFTFLTPTGEPIYRMIGVQRIEDLITADDKTQAALSKEGQ